ncbi:GNAT family N-acetyltransferase [Nocardiopsis sp. JB363]|uniref:GNAT family N-acetyltransferase n=1 Tax=Nocardiopsis sp. JB363 TaxID=1434837 RepID=UPI00097A2437|nr:GNAT family N-acetyltransferase [Nocardiopsis sp. JB363]SIO90308.1 putative acetyltransferase [Nocardiopsis sp. JB363]
MMIRAALPSERTVIGDLRVRAYRDQSLLDASPSYADTLRELGWGAPDEVMAAVDGETVLGTVVYVPWGPRCEAARGPREAEIRAFAVAPEAQRRGVGATLVKAVIERAEREGLDRLVLSTQEIMSGARRLYETHGFTRLPERDWSPVPGVDLLVYVRHLRG